MPETQENNENYFIIEKIKERPVNKKKLLRRTVITAAMAVIFGLVACLTFLVLEPVISNWLYPEEEPRLVVFPEDQEEMSPEEMLSDTMQQENQNQQSTPSTPIEMDTQNVTLEREQIQQILSGVVLDMDNYKQLHNSLSSYVSELKQYLVTVSGVSSNVDWLDNVQQSENQASGVIIFNNGREVLVLVDYTPLRKAESLSMSFYNGTQAEAFVKGIDSTTNLAVLSVELSELNEDFVKNGLKIATLGSSNVQGIVGMPVIALGRPMGTNGSLGLGMITSITSQWSQVDTSYKLLQTDITGSQNAGGVLFNLEGQVVGIISNDKGSTDMKNMITAYGVTELKKRIEKISNGEKIAYLGISGVEVTKEAHDELGVPFGAYIKEIEMNSPAMQAGVQQGDILVKIGERNVLSFSEYTSALMQMKVGDTVELSVMRQVQDEYKEMNFSIVLGELED